MKRNIRCIKNYRGEAKNVCYMVYIHHNNINIVPICCFTNKEDAIKYCENHNMIQFQYTNVYEMVLDENEYEF